MSGNTAVTDRKNPGPPIASAGKSFTAAHSRAMAVWISVGVAQPGIQATPCSRQRAATSGSTTGEKMNCAPALMAVSVEALSSTVPAPTSSGSPSFSTRATNSPKCLESTGGAEGDFHHRDPGPDDQLGQPVQLLGVRTRIQRHQTAGPYRIERCGMRPNPRPHGEPSITVDRIPVQPGSTTNKAPSSPPSSMSRPLPTAAVVMNSRSSPGPPNPHAETRGTGSSTSPMTCASGEYRRTLPPPHSATHRQPSESIAMPSGVPSSSGTSTHRRLCETVPDSRS